ncbi:MAG TPA: chitosanase [Rhodothermales bacterium]|nr:chitosanase [Rhodothermales bacterium]
MSRFDPAAVLRVVLPALVLLSCDTAGTQPVTPRPLADFAELLAPEQRRRADALISVFENDTPEIQYGYAEDLHDGRGITAGRAGFCTGTGDAYEVVARYAARRPDAQIVRFLPELRRLLTADDPSDTHELAGYEAAWATAAEDAAFRTVQDAVVDSLYYRPALRRARTAGLKLPLAIVVVYDTIIQHGEGDDLDGLPALIERTTRVLGGTPASGVDERRWLRTFLAVRRATLLHAHDPATREGWRASVDRVDILATLERTGALDLGGPLHIRSVHHTADIP